MHSSLIPATLVNFKSASSLFCISKNATNLQFSCQKSIFYIQWNSVLTNSVVNEHSVITNRFYGHIGHFTTQINPAITNKNGRSLAVRYNRVWLYELMMQGPKWHEKPGANFTNILWAAFFCTKVKCTCFLYSKFGFILFWHKKISEKPGFQMLMKLANVVTFSAKTNS